MAEDRCSSISVFSASRSPLCDFTINSEFIVQLVPLSLLYRFIVEGLEIEPSCAKKFLKTSDPKFLI